jgi:hypothetical protein
MTTKHVPISMRTADQLWAKAEELRQMALTARTADTVTSLIALAERFQALALRKSSEQAVDLATASPTEATARSRLPESSTEPQIDTIDDPAPNGGAAAANSDAQVVRLGADGRSRQTG